ncbi:MAG: Fe-S cluster assembly protein SufD [Pirellulales bacterium]|nr:Fe-S cluster assembly protein SufD [Pirellulales bacterium]
MSGTAVQAGFSQEAFDAFLRSRQEPAWLVQRRQDAWRRFQQLPMPDGRMEEWRRTDIRLFRLDRFGLPAPPPAGAQAPPPLLAEGVDLAGRMATLDSHPLYAELDAKWSNAGVLFGSLDDLAIEHEAVVRPNLSTKAVDPAYDKFSALHAAWWSGGTLLYVPRGVVIDRPLHMLSGLSPGGVDLGHALIVLEEGAEATLLAETASLDPTAAGLHVGAIEILLAPRARLRYVNLQNWGTGVWHFAHQKAIVDRAAGLQWTIGALGSRLAKVNQHVALVGPDAHTQVNGVMFTEGKQHLSYHTLQHHAVPNCRSDLLYKGALQDRSHLVWRGMIHVDKNAIKTDAYQRDDNLILSDSARADSIPGLEILADDVRCSHGATAGRVDDEQIFYTCSRGLTRREAIRMIVAGFFQQVFDRITIGSVRDALGDAIRRRVREYA